MQPQPSGPARCERSRRIDCGHPSADQLVAAEVRRTLNELGIGSASELVVVCIGTDRSTGDALGPLVGTILKDSGEFVGRLLGTLDEPVHAGNLKETLSTLADDNQRRMVLAIDACLGQSQQVGTICVGTGPIRPGAGVNKDLPLVGDLHVTGTVNVGGFMEYLVLQNTRLSLVLRMARAIARGLAAAVAEFPRVVSPGGAAPHQ